MLRCMTSAVSGLNINQTSLDITGNNIANMSTIGFKSQRAIFADTLSQSSTDAKAPSPNTGGSNAIQIGLGATIAGVDTMQTQGNFLPTSRNLDCAIDGDGFFAVAECPTLFNSQVDPLKKESISISSKNHKISDNPRAATVSFTRDGSFSLDKEGNLVTSSGMRILGYSMVNTQTKVDGKDFDFSAIQSVADDGNVNFVNANAVDGQKFTAVRTYIAGTAPSNTFELKTLKIPETVRCPIVADDGSVKFDTTTTGVAGTDYKDVRVKTFSIEKTGLVKAVLDDGSTTVLGQIATVGFSNPAGLLKMGKNCMKDSSNSGDPTFRSAYVGKYQKDAPVTGGDIEVKDYSATDKEIYTSDNSKAFGNVVNGVLEMSNVDIAEQFTKMIEATRAFQANGKMISTADEILQDLVNLKR